MKKMRICIWGGWYGSKNAGDNAILVALKETFDNILKEPEITVFARNASYIKTEYGVDAFSPFKEILQIIQSIRKSDILLIGGGTPFYDGLYQQLTLLFYFFWAKIFSKKIMVYAVSSQEIKTRTGKAIIRMVLNNVSLITVRESETKKIFEQLGVTKEIVLTTDPAILLKPACDEQIERIFIQEGLLPELKPIVGLCPRFISEKHAKKFYHKAYSREAIVNYKQVMAKIADKLTGVATPVFIPLHMEEPHRDHKIISEIMALMENPEKAYVIKSQYKPQEIMGIVSRLQLLIGVRFHSLVFAAASAVPMIAVSYGPKVSGFIKDVGQSQYLCNLDCLTFEELREKVDGILSNSDTVKSDLHNKRLELIEDALLNAERMAYYLHDHGSII